MTITIRRRHLVGAAVLAAVFMSGMAVAQSGGGGPVPGDEGGSFSSKAFVTAPQGYKYMFASGRISRCWAIASDTAPSNISVRTQLIEDIRATISNYGTVTETVRVVQTSVTDSIVFDTTPTVGPGSAVSLTGLPGPVSAADCTFSVQMFANSLNIVPGVRTSLGSAKPGSDELRFGGSEWRIFVDNGDGYEPIEETYQSKFNDAYSCAEGSTITGRFELYILMVSDVAQNVNLTFFPSSGPPVTKTVALPANTRVTTRVNDFPEVAGKDGVSTVAVSQSKRPFDLAASMIARIDGSSSLAEITCNGI